MNSRLSAAFFVVALSLTAQDRLPSRKAIEGVWRVVEEQTAVRHIPKPNIGFLMITGKHFSLVRESQDIQRIDVSDVDNATAHQLLKMWGPFAAQFGTYELKGDIMTLNILVAKNPSLMGQKRVQRVKVDGDTLMMEPYIDSAGKPQSKPIVLKFTRVE